MARDSWLKAGGIFLLSLGLAAGMGMAFSALSPVPECSFPVTMVREPAEGGIRATIAAVNGSYAVEEVVYRVVVLRNGSSGVVAEGNLTDALVGDGPVIYFPQDLSSGFVSPGDYFLVDGDAETHLILLKGDTPLGWTAGCF